MSIKDQFNLQDKVALVTGGAGYLAEAICATLAEAGANVVVSDIDIKKADRRAKELSEFYGIQTIACEMDISNKDSVNNTIEKIMGKMGRIDILVNNAYFGSMGTIEDMSDEDWKKGIDGTINGVFRCTQAVIPHMIKGSILNIASMYGMVSPDPGVYGNSGLNNPPNYGAGKAAIIQFTKYSACHLAAKSIRVNSISPGAFPSDKVQKNKVFIESLNKKIPMGRIGTPDDLKGAVLFLASDASEYVTGINIPVDGGWTAW